MTSLYTCIARTVKLFLILQWIFVSLHKNLVKFLSNSRGTSGLCCFSPRVPPPPWRPAGRFSTGALPAARVSPRPKGAAVRRGICVQPFFRSRKIWRRSLPAFRFRSDHIRILHQTMGLPYEAAASGKAVKDAADAPPPAPQARRCVTGA